MINILKLWIVVNMFIFAASFGVRGQERPAPTVEVRAYSARLLDEISKTLTCSAQTFELADKITKLEAELAEAKKAKDSSK